MNKKVTDKDILKFINIHLDSMPYSSLKAVKIDDCRRALDNVFKWVYFSIKVFGPDLVDINMHVNRMNENIDIIVSGKNLCETMLEVIRQVIINEYDMED